LSRNFLRHLGLATYGADELLLATLACASSAYALSLLRPALSLLPLIPYSIVLWFFRDPDRNASDGTEVLVAPADGTVTDVVELDEFEFIGGRALRIGIFLSPFNVHVNRSPCEGVVLNTKFRAGEFLPAYNPKAPERNESLAMALETPAGVRLIVKQVTGVLARRIICEAQVGERLERGQRYGMIKFGSRTELYIPLSAGVTSLVAVGDKVKGGETAFCRIATAISPQKRRDAENSTGEPGTSVSADLQCEPG